MLATVRRPAADFVDDGARDATPVGSRERCPAVHDGAGAERMHSGEHVSNTLPDDHVGEQRGAANTSVGPIPPHPAPPHPANPTPDPIPIPLGDEILLAFSRGDHAQAARLAKQSPVEAWYSIAPEQMAAVLEAAPQVVSRSPTLRAFRLLLEGDGEVPEPRPQASGRKATGEAAAGAFGARLRGMARQSGRLAARAGLQGANLLFDDTRGWRLFLSVQSGINEMLVGEFREAITSFGAARHSPPPRTLMFLHRDAYVKSALIHALFGDHDVARAELDVAASLPRTTSWAEAGVSAHAQIAEALLCDDASIEASIASLERLQTTHVGEMWPFWLEAMVQLMLRSGRLAEGMPRVLALASSTPVSAPTEGFGATIGPRLRALEALIAEDYARIADEIARAPQDQVVVALTHAIVECATGRFEPAITRLVALRPKTRHLPRLDALRTILIASAVLPSGDHDRARQLLAGIADVGPDALRRRIIVIPGDVQDFAVREVPGWPADVPVLASGQASAPAPRLSARELEVLRLMASEMTREQIANELFVSVNTVKTQQRSISRKLGVTGRVHILLEAERWGLLS